MHLSASETRMFVTLGLVALAYICCADPSSNVTIVPYFSNEIGDGKPLLSAQDPNMEEDARLSVVCLNVVVSLIFVPFDNNEGNLPTA